MANSNLQKAELATLTWDYTDFETKKITIEHKSHLIRVTSFKMMKTSIHPKYMTIKYYKTKNLYF